MKDKTNLSMPPPSKREEMYVNTVTDLFTSGLFSFLPFDKKENPQGDKSLSKMEIFSDLGVLSKSLKNGTNELTKSQKLHSTTNNASPDFFKRSKELKTKNIACNKLLQLKRNPSKSYSENSVVGKFVKSLAGEVTINDSEEISNYVGGLFKETFDSIFKIASTHNLKNIQEGDKFSSNETTNFITHVSNSISSYNESYNKNSARLDKHQNMNASRQHSRG